MANMPTYTCECLSEACEGCDMLCSSAPQGGTCPKSGEAITNTYLQKDSGDDGAFSLSNRYGLSWNKQIRPALVKRQTNSSGQLICGICGGAIAVDSSGKIQYTSVSGKLHVEYPPIDHYNPDWAQRKASVEKSSAYVNGDLQKKTVLLVTAFNADPLRITCKSCNLKRPKWC